MSHPHPDLGPPPPLEPRRPAGRRARRPGRDRPQHDGVRARRAAARRRLRRAVPGGGAARDRPDPAGLHLPAGPPRRRSRPSCITHGHEDHLGGRAVPAARAPRHPGHRQPLHPRAARGQAARAPDHPGAARGARGAGSCRSGRSAWSSSRSTTRSRTRSRSRSAPRPASCCTPATSRWTSCRSTAGSPTSAASPGSAGRASTCCCRTPPTPRCPASSRRSARSARCVDDVVRTSTGRVIVACFASHVHRVQQVLDAAERHGRHVAFVGRSMVRNMGVARDLGLLRVPPGLHGRHEGRRAAAGPPGRAGLDRLAGRAAVGAVPDGQPEPPPDPDRGAGHRRARVLAHPRQRERRLPGHQRAVPLGRPRGAQGRRQGARLRARAGRRAAVPAQRRTPVQPHAGARRVAAPARARRARPAHRACPRSGSCSPTTASSSTSSTARPRSSARCPAATSTSTASRSATSARRTLKDRRILGDEGFISVTVAIDAVTGKVTGGPQIAARGFSDDPRAFDPVRALIEAELDGGAREGVTDVHAVAQAVRRVVGRWVSDTYRRRPMIIPVVVEV